jgi:hypothetical protein
MVHYIDGQVSLTGKPGHRDWYANLMAHPEFNFRLMQTVTADLPARAMPIRDAARRRAILARVHKRLGGARELDAWVEGVRWSPCHSSRSDLVARQRGVEVQMAIVGIIMVPLESTLWPISIGRTGTRSMSASVPHHWPNHS